MVHRKPEVVDASESNNEPSFFDMLQASEAASANPREGTSRERESHSRTPKIYLLNSKFLRDCYIEKTLTSNSLALESLYLFVGA
jgi:hypothetical protein